MTRFRVRDPADVALLLLVLTLMLPGLAMIVLLAYYLISL